VAGDFETHIDGNVVHATDGFRRRNQGFAQTGDLAFGRVAEFDVERDITTADLQVLQRLGADKVFARVGVQHSQQGVQNRLLFYSHLKNLRLIRICQ